MKKLDLVAMKKGAKKLIGTKDFSTFRASNCRAKSPIKTMKLVKITSFKNKVEIEFRSQSFLQQQVRSMVGCLKYLGEKKWSIKKFDKDDNFTTAMYLHTDYHGNYTVVNYQNFINESLKKIGLGHLKAVCFNPYDKRKTNGVLTRKGAP